MTTKRLWLVAGVLAAGAALRAAETPAPATYPLKAVSSKDMKEAAQAGRPCYRWLPLDKNGCAEVPFATASGKLRVKLDAGKLLLDRNDDGKFDEADGNALPNGEATDVPVKLAGKDLAYRVGFQSLGDGAGRAVLLLSLTRLETQIGPTVVRIFDGNCNGRFDDVGPTGQEAGDLVQAGDKTQALPIGKFLCLDGAIQEFEILNGGEALRLRPYAGPAAKLTTEAAEGWHVKATLRHTENGFQTEAADGTPGAALPGAYQVAQVLAQFGAQSESADPRPAAVVLYAVGDKGATVQVSEGQNRLRFGPPLKLEFTASRSPEDEASFEIADVALVGAGGERYRACNYGSGGASALTSFARAGQKEQKISSLSYG